MRSNRLRTCRQPALALVLVGSLLPGMGICAEPAGLAAAPRLNSAGVELFETSIRPLLVQHCYECHAAGEQNGGLLLDSRDGLLRGGDTGPAIVPGQPDQSLLIQAVRYTDHDLQMPPGGRLSAAEIAVLEEWVTRGAPDPREQIASVDSEPTGMSIEQGRKFWSFQPLANPPVPRVANSAWVRTPIDAFVLAKLQQHGLEPAPQADRLTLLRRVHFNLTGLPPSPAEVGAFLRDESADALKRVVERLLKSPHYGVRWGRHWLDVARYADSNGLDENLALGNAWRYRDYVVDAFNQDMPFDQFLVEQIAGDLLPDADQQTRTATGFLQLGAKVLAEPDMDKLLMDTIDEQLDAMGKAFMGLTLGCARCHDHKFDPLKQTDYYALAAIFKSTKTFGDTKRGAIKHWYEHVFATEEELAHLKVIDDEIAEKKQAAAKFKSTATSQLRQAARELATEYLMACTQLAPSDSLTKVAEVARPLGLHPRILHHCRRHLAYHRDDAFFRKWHELAVGKNAGQKVEAHFRPLFAAARAAGGAARQENPNIKSLADPQLEAARAALEDISGFLAVPAKPEHAFDPQTLRQYYQLMEEARVVESNAPDADAAMGVTDAEILTSLPLHIRGSHRNLGAPVARNFPEVMRPPDSEAVLPPDQSGRLQLARWLARPQHPLTARVYVNRIWRWHFGQGIVKTTENFGQLGTRPSHPRLLDWLARYFIRSGWSTKALHRLILASSVYQMASVHPHELAAGTEQRRGSGNNLVRPTAIQVDPENRLLWKFRIQRLEAEQIRDTLLASSGRLDETMGGKTVPLRNRQFVFNHTSVDHTKYDSLRRAIYLPVIRNNIYTLFEQFDYPDPTMPTGSRSSTVVAPQALLMLNSDLVMDSADKLARLLHDRAARDERRIELAYHRILGRPPTPAEVQRALDFLTQFTSKALTDSATVDPAAHQQAWSLFCQSLYASNEFMYLR